ncbi:MAG: class I SAM-dependent methyltransferase [Nitrospinales bacterium]
MNGTGKQQIDLDDSRVTVRKSNCLLCGANRPVLLFQANNLRKRTKKFFPVSRCSACGFVYSDVVPDDESLSLYYQDNEEHLPQEMSLLEKGYYNLFRRLPVRSGKVLDVGCGNGRFLSYIRDKGYEAVGTDLYGLEYPKNILKLNVHKGQLYDIGFAPESFDVVCFWGSLEHIQDPLRTLQEARRILKQNGHVVAWTLNRDSFEARMFTRYWHHMYVPEHFSQFSDKTLGAMIEKAGFTMMNMRHDMLSFGFVGSLQGWLYSRGINMKIHCMATNLLALPFDILASLCKKSGLITAYARKR